MAHIGAAGDRLVAAMHERGEDVDADVYVSLLGALMDTYLNRVSGEADHPTFVPCCGYYQHLGSPNPDTVYRRAPVDDTATYRLTGERGTAWQVTIMPFTEMMSPIARKGIRFLIFGAAALDDVTSLEGSARSST